MIAIKRVRMYTLNLTTHTGGAPGGALWSRCAWVCRRHRELTVGVNVRRSRARPEGVFLCVRRCGALLVAETRIGSHRDTIVCRLPMFRQVTCQSHRLDSASTPTTSLACVIELELTAIPGNVRARSYTFRSMPLMRNMRNMRPVLTSAWYRMLKAQR